MQNSINLLFISTCIKKNGHRKKSDTIERSFGKETKKTHVPEWPHFSFFHCWLHPFLPLNILNGIWPELEVICRRGQLTSNLSLIRKCHEINIYYFLQVFSSQLSENIPTERGITLTLYSIDIHFDASTTDSFWKRGKRRNCSSQAISSFPTMFPLNQIIISLFVHIFDILSLFCSVTLYQTIKF